MGGSNSKANVPPINPVAAGKTRICIAGFTASSYTGLAHRLSGLIGALYSENYETWYYWDSQERYYIFLKDKFDPVPFPPHLKGHSSSPFVWLEHGETNSIELIGGATAFQAWVLQQPDLALNNHIKSVASGKWKFSDIFHTGNTWAKSTANIRTPVRREE